MVWWRQLRAAVHPWGGGSRLIVIPIILFTLIPFSLAVGLYLTLSGPEIWAELINWPHVVTKAALGVGTPLGLWLVWWYSKPARRVVWVFDWFGGGLLALSAVWAVNILQDMVYFDRLSAVGRYLVPATTAIWGGVGIGLMMASTAFLSDELRSECQERIRLEALIEFTRQITNLDYQTIMNEVVLHLHRLLGTDACVLYLWDENNQVLSPVAQIHDPKVHDDKYVDKVMKFKCPLGFGLTGWVMLTGAPYISRDVWHDAREQHLPGQRQEDRSAMLTPILVEGRRLGVVRLTRSGLDQFNQGDLDLAASFANQAALVIEHGRVVKELSDLSITDPLTGLNNARHFHQVLDVEVKRALRYQQPLSLVMIDSDSLKQVNDRLGHQRGDEHLRSIAAAMRRAVRSTDYAFRYAGDEFLLLLPNTDVEEAHLVAERFRHMMESHEIAEGVVGTVSVGVATLPTHAVDTKGLLAASDAAMYVSKRTGKNRVSVATTLSKEPAEVQRGLY